MVSKGDRVIVLWPEYFDSKRSRGQGRRVPRSGAVPDPDIEEIARAARSLKMDPFLERDAAHPSSWWMSRGRVVLRKTGSKTRMISRVSKRIIFNRRSAGSTDGERPQRDGGSR